MQCHEMRAVNGGGLLRKVINIIENRIWSCEVGALIEHKHVSFIMFCCTMDTYLYILENTAGKL